MAAVYTHERRVRYLEHNKPSSPRPDWTTTRRLGRGFPVLACWRVGSPAAFNHEVSIALSTTRADFGYLICGLVGLVNGVYFPQHFIFVCVPVLAPQRRAPRFVSHWHSPSSLGLSLRGSMPHAQVSQYPRISKFYALAIEYR